MTERRGDVKDQARNASAKANATAGVEIIELKELDQLKQVAALYSRVWSKNDGEPMMPVELLRAFAHTNNYVVGAFASGRMLGALCGFFARHHGQPSLHSHILGVLPELQGRSVGFALKLHQRAWALAHGVERVTWTFDPLVARNAFFNFAKLGAGADRYLPNFYGRLNDGINAGEESDRILVDWQLSSERAIAASTGFPNEPNLDELRAEGAETLLEQDKRSQPRVNTTKAPVLLCQIPGDVVGLRAEGSDLARAWRLGLRETLGEALSTGYVVNGFTRSGWYVLTRGD